MSDYNPTAPYVFQPDPVFKKDGSPNDVIYALSGPGAEEYWGKRFTKADAEAELRQLIERLRCEEIRKRW